MPQEHSAKVTPSSGPSDKALDEDQGNMREGKYGSLDDSKGYDISLETRKER